MRKMDTILNDFDSDDEREEKMPRVIGGATSHIYPTKQT